MSWDAYVSQNLMCDLGGGLTLKAAALVGQEDGSVWAGSEDFPELADGEFSLIKKILDEPQSNPGSFTIGGVKYMVLGSEDNTRILRGKCTGGGVTIFKTEQVLVIGINAVPVTEKECDRVVRALADYLSSVGF